MSRKTHQPWDLEQTFLVRPSPREWLPPEHPVYFVLDVVRSLDLSPVIEVIQAKDARGQKPYNPVMMVALLVYGYCTGVFSSRRLERACQEDVGFRILTANRQPHLSDTGRGTCRSAGPCT
jgi:transposase